MGYCKDVYEDPSTWAAFLTFVGVLLVGVGSWQLVANCAKADDISVGTCTQDYKDVTSRISIFFFVSILILMSAFVQSLVAIIRKPLCGKCMTQNRISSIVTFITAVAVTIYSTEFTGTLESVESNKITSEQHCIICPNSNNSLYLFILWLGVTCVWIALCVLVVCVVYTFCYPTRPSSNTYKLQEKINNGDTNGNV